MSTDQKNDEIDEARVVVGRLHRVRRGKRTAFQSKAPPQPAPPAPARVAVLLVLAHTIERLIEQGEVRDQAEFARRLGITRARVSQILDLTLLAPSVQEAVLAMETIEGREPIGEHALREIYLYGAWPAQQLAWDTARAEERTHVASS